MRSSVNISNALGVIKVLIKSAGEFFFFLKEKTQKAFVSTSQGGSEQARTQGTGPVSCHKNLCRKLTANNIGDPAKKANLG